MVKKLIGLIFTATILHGVMSAVVSYEGELNQIFNHIKYIVGYSFLPTLIVYSIGVLIYHYTVRHLGKRKKSFAKKPIKVLLAVLLAVLMFTFFVIIDAIYVGKGVDLGKVSSELYYPLEAGLIVGLLYNYVFRIK